MSFAETAETMERVRSVVNDRKRGKKAVRLLSKPERDALEEEKQTEAEKIHAAKTFRTGVDVSASYKRIQDIDMQLEQESPTMDLKPQTIDELSKEERRLREKILQGMPSREVMRRNPYGAVDRHIAWEKENKTDLLIWKNIKRQLEPNSEDRDLSNFEKFRPETTDRGGTSSFMGDAQISGHVALSEKAKENFPESMGNDVNSALAQVEKTETRVCACGCGEEFKPVNASHVYKNAVCRQRASRERAQELVQMHEASGILED